MRNNKTILVTGSSRGIGRAIIKKFAENGYNVVINYNNSEEEAKNFLNYLINNNCNAIAIKADISDKYSVNKMIEEIYLKFGKIDILVNNASVSFAELFHNVSDIDEDKIFDINIKGTFNVTKAVLPKMIAEKFGKIINISSMWGEFGSSMEVHYSATKGAINSFTKSLAKELAPSNITVNAVAPGAVDTDMMSTYSEEDIAYIKNETPLGRFAKTEEIAETVFFIAEKTGDFYTGHIFNINGGYCI